MISQLILVTLITLLGSIQIGAQSTVPSKDGTIIYECDKNPSVIQGFRDICPPTCTTTTGEKWPLQYNNVLETYFNAPESYYSVEASDINVACVWSSSTNSKNSLPCGYSGGAATGTYFTNGHAISPLGTGKQQTCPSLTNPKPQPSPVSQYACATIEQGGQGSYLYSVRWEAQRYNCQYLTNAGALSTCTYNSDTGKLVGTSKTLNACPISQCQAVQAYTRRRSLPQPADRRQTTREDIVARQKNISERS
ncbi:uncharacterized protein L201_005159 [Kwoniella dendrophila CBS 6074]|uniref:Ig-like domain-containing protein n=1 Tax=Kwoniella dendrophila CBS 6074 TaxID=1295534 RepID=A0AAX4JXR1_9TREE